MRHPVVGDVVQYFDKAYALASSSGGGFEQILRPFAAIVTSTFLEGGWDDQGQVSLTVFHPGTQLTSHEEGARFSETPARFCWSWKPS